MSELLIKPGQVLTGALFSEPMRVETVRANGPDAWIAGLVGLQSTRFRSVTLTRLDLDALTIQESVRTYDGDGRLLWLGLQAYSLGIAYEFDPRLGDPRGEPLLDEVNPQHLLPPQRLTSVARFRIVRLDQ